MDAVSGGKGTWPTLFAESGKALFTGWCRLNWPLKEQVVTSQGRLFSAD